MSDDRRSAHASPLRAFFNQQLDHLHGLLSQHQSANEIAADDRELIEHFVDLANSRLRIINDYAGKLRGHVCCLHRHVMDLADTIPPAVELSRATFVEDAMINALFVNPGEIDRLLIQGSDLEHLWRQLGRPEQLYALLVVKKQHKFGFGVGMLGNLLVRDLPRETINFSGHKLLLASQDSEALQGSLRNYLLDSVIRLMKLHLAQLLMQQEYEADHSYRARLQSLANPEIYLQALIAALASPTALLAIEQCRIRVNKLGVMVDDKDSDQVVNEFIVPEVQWADGSRQVMLPVIYRVAIA